MIEKLERVELVEVLSKLLIENHDIPVTDILKAVLRRKNFTTKTENLIYLDATDKELFKALKITEKQI